MTDYQKQAKDFLKACNATMIFECLGPMYNENWNDNTKHNRYTVTLTTPKGKMVFDFWDSFYNTTNKKQPTEYDILACLGAEAYEPGTLDDFFDEFGYEINKGRDALRFLNTYNAYVKQYRDLCRIFTEEQMEMLREIQ